MYFLKFWKVRFQSVLKEICQSYTLQSECLSQNITFKNLLIVFLKGISNYQLFSAMWLKKIELNILFLYLILSLYFISKFRMSRKMHSIIVCSLFDWSFKERQKVDQRCFQRTREHKQLQVHIWNYKAKVCLLLLRGN